MKILIFGAAGKLGLELIDVFADRHIIIPFTRLTLDLNNGRLIDCAIKQYEPDIVINAAAQNGLEQCVDNSLNAWNVNSSAPAVMAMICSEHGIPFIHFSTDYVFNGDNYGKAINEQWNSELTESDQPHPIDLYGITKLEGEKACLRHGGLVFRLSTLYGRSWSGPVGPVADAMKQFAKGIKCPTIHVMHQWCAPTSAMMVAEKIREIVEKMPPKELMTKTGIYHLATRTAVWRNEFVPFILRETFGTQNFEFVPLQLPIPRPIYSFLKSSKVMQIFDISLPNYQEDFLRYLPFMPPVAKVQA